MLRGHLLLSTRSIITFLIFITWRFVKLNPEHSKAVLCVWHHPNVKSRGWTGPSRKHLKSKSVSKTTVKAEKDEMTGLRGHIKLYKQGQVLCYSLFYELWKHGSFRFVKLFLTISTSCLFVWHYLSVKSAGLAGSQETKWCAAGSSERENFLEYALCE